jgi:GTP-binding protein Era
MLNNEVQKKCEYIIHGAAVSAGAVGLSPIPGSDAPALLGIQISMLIALGSTLQIPMTEHFAKSLAKNALAQQAGKMLAGQLAKAIPFIGSVANAGVAFGLTETLGWDFVNEYSKQTYQVM